MKNKTIRFSCLAVAGGMNTHQKENTHQWTNSPHFIRILVNNELCESLFGSWDFALLDFFHSLSINVDVMTQFFAILCDKLD